MDFQYPVGMSSTRAYQPPRHIVLGHNVTQGMLLPGQNVHRGILSTKAYCPPGHIVHRDIVSRGILSPRPYCPPGHSDSGHSVSGHSFSGHSVSGHSVSGHSVSGHTVSGACHPWVCRLSTIGERSEIQKHLSLTQFLCYWRLVPSARELQFC